MQSAVQKHKHLVWKLMRQIDIKTRVREETEAQQPIAATKRTAIETGLELEVVQIQGC